MIPRDAAIPLKCRSPRAAGTRGSQPRPCLQGETFLLLRWRGPGGIELTATADLCTLWAFTLPDRGRFLSFFSCQVHGSRPGEACVVRELRRKFSRPDVPPSLPSHRPRVSWVRTWWGEGGGGGRGVVALTLAISFWHSANAPSGLRREGTGWNGTGRACPGETDAGSGESGVCSLRGCGGTCVSRWECRCLQSSHGRLRRASCPPCSGERAGKSARGNASQR